jgi:hypothetical protein
VGVKKTLAKVDLFQHGRPITFTARARFRIQQAHNLLLNLTATGNNVGQRFKLLLGNRAQFPPAKQSGLTRNDGQIPF